MRHKNAAEFLPIHIILDFVNNNIANRSLLGLRFREGPNRHIRRDRKCDSGDCETQPAADTAIHALDQYLLRYSGLVRHQRCEIA